MQESRMNTGIGARSPRRRCLALVPLVACSFGMSVSLDARAATRPVSGRGIAPGASLEELPASDFTIDAARHLLMRAGFGASPAQIRALHRLGLDGMVDHLVDYEATKSRRAGGEDVYVWRQSTPPPTRLEYARMTEQQRRAARRRFRQADQRQLFALKTWWIRRMLTTRRPLEERMTLFWHGHFTTSYRDVRRSKLIAQQHDLLRAHATANFGELLVEVSRDPAMLAYLNNNQNRRGRPNENFAREVMELFTLGLGEYDESDIREAARAFTGWTFDRRGQFRNNRFGHDNGLKTVFGVRGRHNGVDMCRLLLQHESCAPYIASKLFAYFAYADPEPEVRDALGAFFRARRFEIKPLLKKIFKSRAFYSPRARGQQIKSPIVLLVSTARMLGMTTVPALFVARSSAALGQDLFAPPNVKGWEAGLAWITTSSLLERDNACAQFLRARALPRVAAQGRGRSALPTFSACGYAQALLAEARGGAIAGAAAERKVPSANELVDALATALLCVELAPATRRALIAFAKGEDGSLPLRMDRLRGADAERKLRELLHLLMSSPEFQVC